MDSHRHSRAGEPTTGLLWSIIAASAVVHVASLVLGQTLLADWRWQQLPFHSSLEMIGSLIAVEVARQLLSLESRKDGGSYNVQIAAALIAMGVLDGAHAMVHAGNCFVWLHSIATFFGGVLFASVWLPKNWRIWRQQAWPLSVLATALALAVGSLAMPHQIPVVVEGARFTLLAKVLNVAGGIFLLAAAGRLLQTWFTTRNHDDLLFCLHCSLFGAAAIMFEQSSLWDLPWWGWHILRLMAYLVAYLFVLQSNTRAINRQLAMRRELRDIQNTLQSAPVGILVTSQRGLVTYANSRFLEDFGWSLPEILQLPVETFVPEPLRERHAELRKGYAKHPVQRLMQTTGTLFGVTKQGNRLPVEIGLCPLDLAEGPCILATVTNISARWEAERERDAKTAALAAEVSMREQSEVRLRLSNEALQQFAYAASHDMQEPLRAIAGYCELLGEQYTDRLDERGRGFIQHAVDGAHRLQKLIEELLDYSRISTRGNEFEQLNTAEVVREALSNLTRAIQETAAEVTIRDLPSVTGDRGQLVRLFQNLIGNAIKFHGDAPPQITISGCRAKHEIILEVRDNGIGIPPEYHERIFTIFQRLHTRTAYPGTGMGLAICKRIVDRHGGWIRVQPAEEGGSIFAIGLPTTPQATATPVPAEALQTSGDNLTPQAS